MRAVDIVALASIVGLLVLLNSLDEPQAQAVSAHSAVELVSILETSRDKRALEAAAVALASSNDPQAVVRLGEFLRRAEFLARLDDLNDPAFKTWHLRRVFEALTAHPSDATERLCVMLVSDPAFLAVDDRRIHLLPALAAVRPMSDVTAKIFRSANADGYYSMNAPLLVKNSSPNALALFEEMIRDRAVPVERRNDALHVSILPWRTNIAVIESASRLLAASLESEVAAGVIESVFDDQSRHWFGLSRSAPIAPRWEDASRAALQRVLGLATQAKSRRLSPELAAAVDRTVTVVQQILAVRRP